MNEIDLYDIISLKNGKDYTVIKIGEEKGKKYFFLAREDEKNKMDMNDIRVVEEIEKSGKKFVKEMDDDILLKELEKKFFTSLDINLKV